MQRIFYLLFSCLFLTAVPASQAQLDVTYADLVQRLVDLQRLAEPPSEGEACVQWASYDRASRYDEPTGRYEQWDANGDGGGVIRREGDSFVVAEMDGPGCIWRIWSALPEQGHVRMYLDGAEAPVVNLPFRAWFDGSTSPFTRPALVHTVASGWNNYTPIPFQKSCKIVADQGWGNYYQFVYTKFPAGTRLPTFRLDLAPEDQTALDRVDAILRQPGPKRLSDVQEDVQVDRHTFSVPAGQSRTIDVTGPRALTNIRLKIALPDSPQDRVVLREHTIAMRWDGESTPSVWAPLGDFFGTAAGANAYGSLPAGLTKDGWWYANWYMPFAQHAAITLSNDGTTAREIVLEVEHGPLAVDAAQLMRFHAKWHRDALLPTEPERAAIDWTMLATRGRGRFVGVHLHVWNPRGGWWGEGDEKFHVDGEPFPSTFGTGSEDYFGYAWCNPTLFQHAYHNQTISMNNKGHVSVNRWHIADNIPFQTSFAAYIEKYFPNERPTLYAATVYWYQMPGGSDPYAPVGREERAGYWDESLLQTWRAEGAVEGEKLAVLRCTGGTTQAQDLSGFEGRWSGDAHVWWTGAQPGDVLELSFAVSTAGRYALIAQCTKAVDYGIMQLSVNDAPLGEPIDFFNPSVVPTGEVTLGEVTLEAGEHRLRIEVIGANAQAVKAYMFGLDYLRLVPP
ncbi:MAG: DUF2961 domain-containing protein [Pirellulaceae bacterium]|jgi:hypothetical protein|nr:DUF2961 domain-containing protein [Pirellulaceae bacterium]